MKIIRPFFSFQALRVNAGVVWRSKVLLQNNICRGRTAGYVGGYRDGW